MISRSLTKVNPPSERFEAETVEDRIMRDEPNSRGKSQREASSKRWTPARLPRRTKTIIWMRWSISNHYID